MAEEHAVQQFSPPPYPTVSVVPRASIPAIGDPLRDALKSSPERMWDLSLRNKERLPDDLHEAMLLWSFDPAQKLYVQFYLDWAGHCEFMKASREKFERQRKMHDRILFGTMVASGLALAAVLILGHIR